jgi:lipoprotein-releasing system ATP-binding protein
MLEAKNIYKSYSSGKKELQVLRGIDILIEKGKFAAIVGPSGAGKSTLMHILGGLDSPTQGHVHLNGEDLYKLSDDEICKVRNKRIGFVFQFYHLLPEFTVLENVLMPRSISNETDTAEHDALVLLEKVGLFDRTHHFPNQLSGGEKQRVALVRALINKPELLFCDEPTGNLDSDTGSEIIALIKQINRESAMTVLLVTHNQDLVKNTDRIYHLKDGLLGG